jgi:REP element-mobilizing transposase RayT
MRDHLGATRTSFAMKLLPAQLNRDREGAPTTYLITWACYGARLLGQEGAVPRAHNGFGARLPETDVARELLSKSRMPQELYLLDSVRRRVVMNSLNETCCHRGWMLLAAHARTNHIHVVITGNCKPEGILIAMKAYSSRALNKHELDGIDRRDGRGMAARATFGPATPFRRRSSMWSTTRASRWTYSKRRALANAQGSEAETEATALANAQGSVIECNVPLV